MESELRVRFGDQLGQHLLGAKGGEKAHRAIPAQAVITRDFEVCAKPVCSSPKPGRGIMPHRETHKARRYWLSANRGHYNVPQYRARSPEILLKFYLIRALEV